MICRGKELQKTQTEHQTETAETTCCCPLPQPHTTCRRSQGVGRGVEKERKQGEHLSHRSQACNAKKKAHHGTRLSPHLSSTTHTHHRISRCEYLPALTLPNDHAISDNRDRRMIFQLVSSPLPVSLQNTQVQMRKTSLST